MTKLLKIKSYNKLYKRAKLEVNNMQNYIYYMKIHIHVYLVIIL